MANYLVHSASNPQPDELYHFKYIRKYKVRGKWRYVYGDDSVHRKMKTSLAVADQAEKGIWTFKNRQQEVTDLSDPTNTRDETPYWNRGVTWGTTPLRNSLTKEYLKQRNTYDRAMSEINKTIHSNPTPFKRAVNWVKKLFKG